MSRGVYAALSGAVAQARALDMVANNLANADSTGFKAERLSFRESLAQARNGRPPDPSHRQVLVAGTVTDFRQGVLMETGNPLDLALEGPGFFAVQTDRGERYVRGGAFSVREDGAVVDAVGHRLLGQSGPVRVDDPELPIAIGADGTVLAAGESVDSLRLVDFAPGALRREGEGIWDVRPGRRREPVDTRVLAGALERSNVNPVQAMTELMWIARAYETFTRAIEIFRDVDRKTTDELTL